MAAPPPGNEPPPPYAPNPGYPPAGEKGPYPGSNKFHLFSLAGLQSYEFVFFFVRDGIHRVADYNSTLMGVVVLVVIFFTMG